MKCGRNFTIKLSQPVYARQQDNPEGDLFERKWLPVVNFFTGLLSRFNHEHNLLEVNQVCSAISELHHRGYSMKIDEALKILMYRELNKQLVSIASLSHTQQITAIMEYFRWLDGAVQLLAEVLRVWEVEYLGRKGTTVRKVLMSVLHHQIINHGCIEQLLVESILKGIEAYRQEKSDLRQCQLLVRITKEIGMFSKSVSPQIYQKTCLYYTMKKDRLTTNIAFLRAVQRQLQKQKELVKILQPEEDLVHVIEKEFISENAQQMVNFLDYLISHNQKEDLDILWSFFQKTDKLDLLEKRLEQLIEDTEKYILERQLEKLIEYKLTMERLFSEPNDEGRQIMQLIQNRFDNILSRNFTLCNQMMVQHVIRSLESTMEVEQADQLLFDMVRSSPSLDLFFSLYRDRLARQILTNDSIQVVRHLGLLDRVKQYCGSSLITPIEKMIDDVWRHGKKVAHQHDIFHCRLLFHLNWPDYKSLSLGIPQQMRQLRQSFQDEYLSKHPHKQLNWCYRFSMCRVSINNIDHRLSELQTSIVFYISKAIRPMRVDDLVQVLKIDGSQVSQNVTLLVNHGLILQDKSSRFLELNESNTNSYEYRQEREKANVTVVSMVFDRDITLEACIIRLLKRHKKMPKDKVIQETQQMVRIFRPTIEQINSCIKKLVSRDYLQIVGNEIIYLP